MQRWHAGLTAIFLVLLFGASTRCAVAGQTTRISLAVQLNNLSATPSAAFPPDATGVSDRPDDWFAASNFSTVVTIYDSVGSRHDLTFIFRKSTAPGEWEYRILANAGEIVGGTADKFQQINSPGGRLVFANDGTLDPARSIMTPIGPVTWLPTRTPQSIAATNISFNGSTQFSLPSSIVAITRNGGNAPADFDNDGKSDIGVYRDGIWSIVRSSDRGVILRGHGGASHIPVPADYDGDGSADIAAYKDGQWSILRSSSGNVAVVGHGGADWEPVPADYDGDGVADIAVYKDGVWSILRSFDGGNTIIGWGGPDFIPVPADHDGDGKTDIAVYFQGIWSILASSQAGLGPWIIGWGGPDFVPVPGDYNGDGLADMAVYKDGVWSILPLVGSTFQVGWGGPSFTAVPGDYDGDGKTDIAVYQTGTWYVIRSSDNRPEAFYHGGSPRDLTLE